MPLLLFCTEKIFLAKLLNYSLKYPYVDVNIFEPRASSVS